jgi:hypothetical protein
MPLPPPASLEGIPPELRTEIYDLVDISTPVRVVSAAKLVTAYQESQIEDRTFLGDTPKVQKFLGRRPCESMLQSPIVDLPTLLDSSTALHPLSRTSRQLYAEYHPTYVQTSGSRYRFVVHNFDIMQMKVISMAIHVLGSSERRDGTKKFSYERRPYDICFATDNDVVSSAGTLCEMMQQTHPSGSPHVKNMTWLIPVTTELMHELMHHIVGAMSSQTSEGKRSGMLFSQRRYFASMLRSEESRREYEAMKASL